MTITRTMVMLNGKFPFEFGADVVFLLSADFFLCSGWPCAAACLLVSSLLYFNMFGLPTRSSFLQGDCPCRLPPSKTDTIHVVGVIR